MSFARCTRHARHARHTRNARHTRYTRHAHHKRHTPGGRYIRYTPGGRFSNGSDVFTPATPLVVPPSWGNIYDAQLRRNVTVYLFDIANDPS